MTSEITKKLFSIVLLIIVISYGLDKIVFFSLNKISDKVMSGQAIGKLNQFLSKKEDADFLVFGSSRANHHIDVDKFSNYGFNIGVDGTGIAYSSTLINTLPINKEQLVIVHLDINNFFGEYYDGSDIRALKSKYHRNDAVTQALDNAGQISVLQKFFYSMNYNGNALGIIKNYFKPNYDHKNYNGYDPLEVSESQEVMRDIVLRKNKQGENECEDSLKINTIGLGYLKSIKSFAEKSPNKIFLFVSSPTYNDNCINDNAKLSAIMHSLGLTYWDFSNLYKENDDNSYWKDATHLSKKGAEAFSLYLLEHYENYILEKTPLGNTKQI